MLHNLHLFNERSVVAKLYSYDHVEKEELEDEETGNQEDLGLEFVDAGDLLVVDNVFEVLKERYNGDQGVLETVTPAAEGNLGIRAHADNVHEEHQHKMAEFVHTGTDDHNKGCKFGREAQKLSRPYEEKEPHTALEYSLMFQQFENLAGSHKGLRLYELVA